MNGSVLHRLTSLAAGFALLISLLAVADRAEAAWLTPRTPWGVIVVGAQGEPERLATIDLQRYLGQVTGKVPKVISVGEWKKKPEAAVAIGTLEHNELLQTIKLDPAALGEEGYVLAENSVQNSPLVLAGGRTSAGAVNAVYGLLKQLGYGFYLGSEAVPDRLPAALGLTASVIRKPALGIRGVLPWYNFFDSPTAWDPIDHRAFVDQLIRSGANFVGFHTYDGEPFAAIDKGGKMEWGARLLNTGTSTWGTHPMPASEYLYGADKFFAQKYFGADTTNLIKDDNEAVRREQDVMRDALAYAKARGLHTCLGFEVTGDPTQGAERENFLARLGHVLDQYPGLDVLWLWQPESEGSQGFRNQYVQVPLAGTLDLASLLVNYGIARRDLFKRAVENPTDQTPFVKDRTAEKMARAIEGARLEQYGQLACHALAHRQNAPKLAISGWGGEDRCLSAEYYEALDKLLPQDVIFTSLEYISPRARIDKIYSELPADRQRWPIPWMENDGDQWHPQPFVHIYEAMMKNVQASGSQGFLAIHWRTREIEENFAYLVESAWQPGLSADAFYQDLARRCYGPEVAPQMAGILNRLDALGYRWAGGSGQSECGNFAWSIGDEEHMKKLEALRAEAQALRPQARRGKERVEWLLHYMDWVIDYERAQIAAIKARELLNEAVKIREQNPGDAFLKAHLALVLMGQHSLETALHDFAQRLTTRGEYGVLATINTKAGWEWRSLLDQANAMVNELAHRAPSSYVPPPWKPAAQIQLPRLLGSVAAGEDLDLMPIVMNGGAAWVHYRALGTKTWTTLPLKTVSGWVRRAVIPGGAIKQPGLEIAFSMSRSPKDPLALGPLAVTVMPKTVVPPPPALIAAGPPAGALKPIVGEGKTSPIELRWNELPEADYYRVLRNGKPVVETGVAFLPDYPDRAAGQYVVQALRGGQVLAASEPVAYRVADRPFSDAIELTAEANQGGVRLRWPATRSNDTAYYKVAMKSPAPKKLKVIELGRIPASRISEHSLHSKPAHGAWTFLVTPISSSGREGNPAWASVIFPPAPVTTPAVDLPLTRKPDGAQVFGNVSFDKDGALFIDGYMEIPHVAAMNLGSGMTLTYEFEIEQTSNEPIMLCHGIWHGDGWYAQVLGGGLMIKTPGYDVNGPKIEHGRWYKVQYVFDGEHNHLWVDGRPIALAPTEPLQVADTARPLVLGQYVSVDQRYCFKGRIRNVKIYPDVLMPEPGQGQK